MSREAAADKREMPFLPQLAQAVGNARVVALGASSHLGAATFELELKIVQYLHEELGFNRVILEAGLFPCEEAAVALKRGASAQEAARSCLFEKNFCFDGAYPLFDYAGRTRAESHPLELSGMDPQLSGTGVREPLVKRLEEVLGEPLEEEQLRAIEHMLFLDLKRSVDERRHERNALLALLSRIRQKMGTRSLWVRVVDGLVFLDEDHWDYQFAPRVTVEMAQLRDACRRLRQTPSPALLL